MHIIHWQLMMGQEWRWGQRHYISSLFHWGATCEDRKFRVLCQYTSCWPPAVACFLPVAPRHMLDLWLGLRLELYGPGHRGGGLWWSQCVSPGVGGRIVWHLIFSHPGIHFVTFAKEDGASSVPVHALPPCMICNMACLDCCRLKCSGGPCKSHRC